MEQQLEDDPLGIGERLERHIGRASRVKSLSIRFTKAEERALEKLAQAEGKTIREWCREALLRQLEPQMVETAVFTELVALRLLLNMTLRPIALGEKVSPEAYAQTLAQVRKDKHEAAQEMLKQYQTKGE